MQLPFINQEKNLALTRSLIIKLAWCLGLSLFWVLFLWEFWQKGVFIMGFNASAFFIWLLTFVYWNLKEKKVFEKIDWLWLLPLFFLALSYSFYENPFIKAVTVPLFPALIILFVNFAFFKAKAQRHWDWNFLAQVLSRFFLIPGKAGEAFNLYIDLLVPKSRRGRGTVRQIVLGFTLFLVLAVVIVIPLLSSADPVFGEKIDIILDWFKFFVPASIVYRLAFFTFLSLLFLSATLAWAKEHDYKEKKESEAKIEPIIPGIVLGGIFILYVLFLGLQFKRLWVGALPFSFAETEYFVKSGFWQLFFLTGLNVLVYFFSYRRTGPLVQKILAAFTLASLLLLASAAERMGLYVYYYGLSYEKFFASYTVFFSAILFVWLIARLFMAKRADIFRFVVFLFLWLFALIALLPVEQLIMRANVALSARPDSRIRLYELTMLSPDVLKLVKRLQAEGKLREKDFRFDREKAPVEPGKGAATGERDIEFDWQPWIEKQEKLIADKEWYEKNLGNFF